MTPEPISDNDLAQAHADYAAGRIGVWDLERIERRHLASQPPIDYDTRPRRGDIALDAHGDAWEWGTTRWTCRTAVDGRRIERVARLPHQTMIDQYGPAKLIGRAGRLTYQLIRGR